jgi:hypothetical protein
MKVAITVADQNYEVDLDDKTKAWTSAAQVERLDKGEFPLVVMSGGKRYELYSDRTFAEVEL